MRFHRLPRLSGFDEFDAVQASVAVLVAVRAARRSCLPIGVIGVDLEGCADAYVLDVTPVEVGAMGRLSAKHKRDRM